MDTSRNNDATGKPSPIELQRCLKGVDYPASRGDLLEAAQRNRAGREVLALLEELGQDRFETPADVMKGYSEGH
jgi:hypothetical protein